MVLTASPSPCFFNQTARTLEGTFGYFQLNNELKKGKGTTYDL